MINYGLVDVACITPRNIAIGDVDTNKNEIKNYIVEIIAANKKCIKNTQLVVFPELSLTGYTCGDLFNQTNLIEKAALAIYELHTFFKGESYVPITVIGVPIRKDNQLFNCAAIFSKDGLLGFVPKTYIPNYSEFYEARYFSSSQQRLTDTIDFMGLEVPFTPNLLIKDNLSDMIVALDICEDVWVPIPPSRYHCLHGANIIANLSGSNETIGKSKYREDLLKIHTSTCSCGYVYTSAGPDESTTDTVFSGHSIIANNGSIIKSVNGLMTDEAIVYGQIDIEKCLNDRYKSNSYMGVVDRQIYKTVTTETFPVNDVEFPIFPLKPFVPNAIDKRATEVLRIQSHGLAQRLKKIHCDKVVLGVSGGLDSTLALLVAVEAFKLNKYDLKGIIGITMPCFGTTERTKNNSNALMKELGITSYEINIKDACIQHYKDIGHDINQYDITFENVQARERTQILMDMANKLGGLVVGTGDLSELALGWCTYNADQMSMYGVNASIPKTLVRHLVNSYVRLYAKDNLASILLDICDTPISPELLPPNPDGTIAQKTEESIGSYITHDFVLYYMMRYGFSPTKIFYLCQKAMLSKITNVIDDNIINNISLDIINNMKIFYKRFFTQQFKRSCMPDGIKVGSISLSPRADWRMPSDANAGLWLNEINKLESMFK